MLNNSNISEQDTEEASKCLHALKNLLKSQKIIQIIIKIIKYYSICLRQNLSEVV